jgi:transposase-like protein
MLLEEANWLLEPGYTSMETGFCRLPNGQMYIAVLTRMPGCKGKWVNWLFDSDQPDSTVYKEFNKDNLSLGSAKERKLREHVKNIFYNQPLTEGKLLKYRVIREDPSQIFDTSKLIEAGVTSVFYAKSYMPDGTPEGQIVHIIKDTSYGCEMRSRFWIYNDTEETAQIRLEHYISVHGYLADSLAKLIKEWQQLDHRDEVTCKFCHSNEVVKNGLRNYTQYWLCKNCGRGFVDNNSLPKMKYPFEIIGKAVYDYCDGRSLRDIRRDIEKQYNLFPSNSTVLGWVKKLTKTTLEGNRILSHSGDRK